MSERRTTDDTIHVPDDWLFLDLEVSPKSNAVHTIGALRGGRSMTASAKSRDDIGKLRRFANGAKLVVGHNWWGFDRMHLA